MKVATRSDRPSGLPKRPITKYYLHNLQLHNLPLRQSYFPPRNSQRVSLSSLVLYSTLSLNDFARIQFRDGKKSREITLESQNGQSSTRLSRCLFYRFALLFETVAYHPVFVFVQDIVAKIRVFCHAFTAKIDALSNYHGNCH